MSGSSQVQYCHQVADAAIRPSFGLRIVDCPVVLIEELKEVEKGPKTARSGPTRSNFHDNATERVRWSIIGKRSL